MQFGQLKRRQFFALLGGGASLPLAAHAQRSAKLPTIGVFGPATALAWSPWIASFVQRLHELGWIEGRTIGIEYRWADGRSERFAEIASEFVRLRVDVILTGQSPVPTLKQATSVIPIVMAIATDPIGTGIVANLAHPGGNVTGLSLQATDLAGKRLELLRELSPSLRRLAILANIGFPAAVLEMGQVVAAARTLGLDAVKLEIRRTEDIIPAFEVHKDRADALYITSDAVLTSNRIRINTLSNVARLPTVRRYEGLRRSGSLDVLWAKLRGSFPARGRVCRQDSAWGETRRSSDRTADQIRFCRKPNHREGARPRGAAHADRPRRRGNRVTWQAKRAACPQLALLTHKLMRPYVRSWWKLTSTRAGRVLLLTLKRHERLWIAAPHNKQLAPSPLDGTIHVRKRLHGTRLLRGESA